MGSVYAIKATDKNIDGILVTISMKQDVNIPKNSVAVINSGLINSSNIIIKKGDATEYITGWRHAADHGQRKHICQKFQASLNPVMKTLERNAGFTGFSDTGSGRMFNPAVKNNFTSIIANLARSSASLQIMLNDRTSSLAHSMNHLDSFTNNLASNNQRITGTLDNLEKTTGKLANAKIDETLQSAQGAMNSLKDAINKVNSPNGTLGLLLNDKKLYLNLENTTRSLNILLDDLRMHPKRYVNISVFGRKDKKGPLMAPLNDTSRQSANQEVMKKPALLLAILIFSMSGFRSFAQIAVPFKSKTSDSTQTVYIWHSDTLRQMQKDSVDIQSLFGHVKLQSEKTFFYTDSLAMNHKDNIIEAFGHVHINDKDSTDIYSDYMKYFVDTKNIIFQKNVELKDGKGTLSTEELHYDMNMHIGDYYNGGKVVNKNTIVTSKEGTYYADTKDVYFKKNVKLKDPAYESDSRFTSV